MKGRPVSRGAPLALADRHRGREEQRSGRAHPMRGGPLGRFGRRGTTKGPGRHAGRHQLRSRQHSPARHGRPRRRHRRPLRPRSPEAHPFACPAGSRRTGGRPALESSTRVAKREARTTGLAEITLDVVAGAVAALEVPVGNPDGHVAPGQQTLPWSLTPHDVTTAPFDGETVGVPLPEPFTPLRHQALQGPARQRPLAHLRGHRHEGILVGPQPPDTETAQNQHHGHDSCGQLSPCATTGAAPLPGHDSIRHGLICHVLILSSRPAALRQGGRSASPETDGPPSRPPLACGTDHPDVG